MAGFCAQMVRARVEEGRRRKGEGAAGAGVAATLRAPEFHPNGLSGPSGFLQALVLFDVTMNSYLTSFI